MLNQIKKSNKGITTILLVLVIVSLISIASFSMANIYVQQIKGSRSADQTIQAYQAADTGAEYALWLILKKNVDRISDCVKPSFCSVPNSTSSCPVTASHPKGKAWYQYESDSTTTVKIKGVCGNVYRSVQINLSSK